MKKLIYHLYPLWIALIISSCNNHPAPPAQEAKKTQPEPKQQPDFNGIYEFKINKTTIKDLAKLPYKARELTIAKDIDERLLNHRVIEHWEILCDDIKVFLPEDFKKNGLDYKNCRLAFYRDTLVLLTSDVNFDLIQ